jgi:GNAT superfamily N-acetyltransferase
LDELTNEHGSVCATMDIRQEDGESWAIVVSWRRDVDGLPDSRAWNEALESNLARCRDMGATSIGSRVITAVEGTPEALVSARAAMHRDSLSARGFKEGEGRVEYRMGLEDALRHLESHKVPSRLSWSCVDADNANEVARAAELLRQASEGDPASHEEDDALSFLEVFLSDKEAVKAPERLQVGAYAGVPAAIVVLMATPSDGWSTIYYMGVLPEFRGRGFGAEAMLHGFRSLKTMGGQTYHDGTGSRNAAARALFSRLGKPPWRVMEEWRLTE